MSDFEVHPIGTATLAMRVWAEQCPAGQYASQEEGACIESVIEEREAAVTHVRAKIEAVQRKRHQLGADLTDHLVLCLDELAEDFSRGLHVR